MASEVLCPKCNHKFSPDESLAKAITEQLESQFQARLLEAEQLAKKRAEAVLHEFKKTEAAFKQREAELEAARVSLDSEVKRRLEAEKSRLTIEARKAFGNELDSVRAELEQQAEDLRNAKAAELDLRKQARELEKQKADMELEVARKLDEERGRIASEAAARASEQHDLQRAEWDKKQQDMLKQIETLRQKADQSSQQAQGEVLELAIEGALREAFPEDDVAPVGKGINGADVIHTVKTSGGARCGSIAWELKRTKSFSGSWIPKLRDDQRAAKADLAVLVTYAMPEGIERIGQLDGVWVCDPKSALGLAVALRASLHELHQSKKARAGQQGKAEQVTEYVTGVEFRGKIQTLAESFVAMRDDLEAERRVTEKNFAKREKQILRAVGAVASTYGDLQGLLGSSLPEVPALSLDVAVSD